jgi:diguanylate cyclase (GGDEF)-like protein
VRCGEGAAALPLEPDELLYVAARASLSALWIAAAIATFRFAQRLDRRVQRLADIGAVLLGLPALISAQDTWDNVVVRHAEPIALVSWVWIIFDGLAPIFCLLLLRALGQRDAAQAALRAAAATDPLTGLANRRGFLDHAEGVLAASRRRGATAAVLLVDIDRFKAINDGFGHAAGDDVLRDTAAVLREVVRRGDLPVRWGGEEFAVLLPFTTLDQAVALAERLRVALPARVPHPAGGGVTLSIGVAALGEATLGEAMRAADDAMYQAKAAGRNRVAIAGAAPAAVAA